MISGLKFFWVTDFQPWFSSEWEYSHWAHLDCLTTLYCGVLTHCPIRTHEIICRSLLCGFSGTLCPKWLSRTKPASVRHLPHRNHSVATFRFYPFLSFWQTPSSSVVFFHLSFLYFQYILCSWFLLYLQKIFHVQKKNNNPFLDFTWLSDCHSCSLPPN